MDFTIYRGQPFREEFNFKEPDGSVKKLDGLEFELIAEHGLYSISLRQNTGLVVKPSIGQISVNLSGEDTDKFPYSRMRYHLYFYFEGGRQEVTSGNVVVLNQE